MALFGWSDEFSVGVSEMDRHHRELFGILNTLHDSMKGGKAEETVLPTINKLLEYTKYHFDKEEQLMINASYPGLAGQQSAHKAFIAKLEEFKAQAEKPGMAIFAVTKVSSTGGEWLKKHITGMDKQYTDFMNKAGIK